MADRYDNNSNVAGTLVAIFAVVLAIILIICFMAGCPRYNVYEQRLQGEAELAKASYNRQIAVQEAHAKMESAKLLADAEVERAKGVAAANQIIGKSLEGNEGYLRYLWIQNLGQTNHETIYVPTEAGLPILEATRRTTNLVAPDARK